ncbi:hypothetical protein C5B91_06130 [Haloferax sp. Atlit-10N]|uniref:DUF7973 domain-containing protein n=1 Tax=Haloferax prahovense (strain DSM 18310 / JCM 13924 / TL6) TaxID=1227461 RepID=M0GJY6_HALPT|nr:MULTISPECIES: hypothetical protein [Haloferax]ELZ71169.1 hypothetical protein C457_07952 [Haloferax prahovense DSM 18310]RDZ47236.1 hypothetical protein C5B87_06125 [Haloferax sp. Atlit-16N]RDZ61070.1 hypothetical protein C5B91_06130 [Haloferax sp. Atlit-10N]
MFETFALQIPVIGVSAERFVVLLLAAFAGGMFGAAIGALPSFIFTGFVVLLGETAGIVIRQFEGADLITAGELGTGITGSIGFGPFVGPHIAFAGGVAASAYAGKRYADMDPSEGGYHFGKDITYAFGTQPDILAVGGLFGVLGLLISRIAGGIGLPLDSVALSVMTTAFIARIAFGYPLIGSPAGSGLLDMSPFEKGTMRGDGSGRPATEPWLPHQYKWVNIVVIGLGAGILGGWTWLITESFFLAYGISAASLLFLNLGVEKIPVTHHITLGGSAFGAVAAPMVGGSEPLIIVAAAVGGLIGALLGEVTQRVAYAHSGTHVDPPAMSITIYSLLIGVLFLLGAIPNSAYLGL